MFVTSYDPPEKRRAHVADGIELKFTEAAVGRQTGIWLSFDWIFLPAASQPTKWQCRAVSPQWTSALRA